MPATTYRRVRPIWLILAALALWAMLCWLAFCTERASSPTSLMSPRFRLVTGWQRTEVA